MKYIDADKLIAKININVAVLMAKHPDELGTIEQCLAAAEIEALNLVLDTIKELQQEQPEVALDKLVNEEFACHSRTTEYGLEVTYNRAELYQLIKRMAFLFNARKEDKI